MTIVERFEAALRKGTDPAWAEPELLPARLARACARTLGVDGAGLSIADAGGRRIPLGASSELAACAERLQFTAGGGPCLTAQEAREPVFAVLADLDRRWPAFTDLLVAQTPYRGAVALPLRKGLGGVGALDLYVEREERVLALDVFAAIAVGDLVTFALSDAAIWSTWAPDRGPDWLHGPDAVRRAAVWEAVGTVGLALGLDAPEALDLMRARAVTEGRTVDDVAADLLTARMSAEDLRVDGGSR